MCYFSPSPVATTGRPVKFRRYQSSIISSRKVNPTVPLKFSEAFDVAKDATGLKAKASNLELLGAKDGVVELGFQ